MFSTIPKAIYERIYTLLQDSSLSYVKLLQRGFVPKNENMLHPSQYPWLFIEDGGTTPPEPYRSLTFAYEYTVSIVAMTLADKGDMENMVFSNGLTNVNKGIGDIRADLGLLFWGHKKGGIGVVGVRDFMFGRTGSPNLGHVTPLLINPFIRGIQMDLIFQCEEKLP